MISPIGETKASKKSRRSLGKGGFTLVEILSVLVIAGIVLALAAPQFSRGYTHFEINQTADDLLRVSRWAQAMAIGQERVYALSFSRDRRAYRLLRRASDEDAATRDSFEPVTGSLGRRHTVPEAVGLHTPVDRIEYYPDGTIDPATIELDALQQKIVLSSTLMRGMMTKVDSE